MPRSDHWLKVLEVCTKHLFRTNNLPDQTNGTKADFIHLSDSNRSHKNLRLIAYNNKTKFLLYDRLTVFPTGCPMKVMGSIL